MKLKRVSMIKNLSEGEMNRISASYEKEGYITESIPTYVDNRGLSFLKNPNIYELHVYKTVKRSKRWYTFNETL
jgi:hypothetical protein